ncbi:MAG: nicotinate-nucleotide diphosphorylase (carboxylating) [Halothiobacillus sp. 24-54-40]|jgi:nicotinate-nucleotide pyrophosphorylase (carboxylating)|nr:MAG: nicotinate-nucleotide diphosphorylase (carboxylating) [Halothiobacillus sp. 20-53-49]OYY37515.1 MAG: nicotinate-nucleotide diphosphorylase (carboxylating) [Halothiobacillus sp. 35-54-62]OYZ87256.1 MAG: nicotinate-nucleotide diphosphorylase (carboxylating) [Halothiobacillus sp. 24-54-40]OZA80828.1 MAG: nicotinate-nucleotide diphosphorylase (carboxylating) [Halothiobacillus sp. 39-53-45]HQS03254.1 carboxylating nicotinate-nucleotide diphosphorylase [Halothiobacillus sp.]
MIDSAQIADDVSRALAEDIGAGDVSARLIPIDLVMRGHILSREPCTLAGLAWAEAAFRRVSNRIEITWHVRDGDPVAAGDYLCTIEGPARALLTGERTALNFLQTLSGTATTTRAYVDAVAGTNAKILDTRKTLPGLRLAQKYAVTCGGGHNHRLGLFDMVLLKENHIMAAGSISAAVNQSRSMNADIPLEVEVETLAQLEEALSVGVTRILLDNFDLNGLRAAVAINQNRAQLESSGNVDLSTVASVAQTGVDFISIGALTKHVRAIDLSLRFDSPDQNPSLIT